MAEFQIEPYSNYDKSITVDGPIRFYVDYNDVDTDAVDLFLPLIIDTLNRNLHRLDVLVFQCHNEDCDEYWRKVQAGDVAAEFKCPACSQPRKLQVFDYGMV